MNKPIPKLTEKQLERFWSRVDKSTNCWIWTGAKVKGYGIFLREKFYAHRVSYFLAKGIDPGDLMVCHNCDTPACVNPNHLWLGNDLDNQHDSISKKRHSHGETSGNVKLTEGSVKAILASSEGGLILAGRHRVSAQTISDIRSGRGWKHLGGSRRVVGSVYANNTTGVKCVSIHKPTGKYRAQVKGKHLGLFNTIKDAAKAVAKRKNT
jgi:hypothetical protein